MDAFEDHCLEFAVTPERVATFRRHFAEWMADKPKLETCGNSTDHRPVVAHDP